MTVNRGPTVTGGAPVTNSAAKATWAAMPAPTRRHNQIVSPFGLIVRTVGDDPRSRGQPCVNTSPRHLTEPRPFRDDIAL